MKVSTLADGTKILELSPLKGVPFKEFLAVCRVLSCDDN